MPNPKGMKYNKKSNADLEQIAYDFETTMMTNKEVADKHGLSQSRLSTIKNTKRYKRAERVVRLRVEHSGFYLDSKRAKCMISDDFKEVSILNVKTGERERFAVSKSEDLVSAIEDALNLEPMTQEDFDDLCNN